MLLSVQFEKHVLLSGTKNFYHTHPTKLIQHERLKTE
jgi:hypothetical protein